MNHIGKWEKMFKVPNKKPKIKFLLHYSNNWDLFNSITEKKPGRWLLGLRELLKLYVNVYIFTAFIYVCEHM